MPLPLACPVPRRLPCHARLHTSCSATSCNALLGSRLPSPPQRVPAATRRDPARIPPGLEQPARQRALPARPVHHCLPRPLPHALLSTILVHPPAAGGARGLQVGPTGDLAGAGVMQRNLLQRPVHSTRCLPLRCPAGAAPASPQSLQCPGRRPATSSLPCSWRTSTSGHQPLLLASLCVALLPASWPDLCAALAPLLCAGLYSSPSRCCARRAASKKCWTTRRSRARGG